MSHVTAETLHRVASNMRKRVIARIAERGGHTISVQSTPSNPSSLRSWLTFFPPILTSSTWLFPRNYLTKVLCSFLIFPIQNTCLSQFIFILWFWRKITSQLIDHTDSMGQSPTSEANFLPPSQEIIFLLWNQNVYFRVHKSPPLVSYLSHNW
jgi:hypothetical protein